MLEIKNLSKSFDDKILFKNFSYSFSDRGIYAVVGESGIGKTTLLRMIAGLDKDYDGEIIGGGIGKVSFAFQEYRLFPWLSAIDNVIFAISDRKDEAVTKKAYKMLSKLACGGLLNVNPSGGPLFPPLGQERAPWRFPFTLFFPPKTVDQRFIDSLPFQRNKSLTGFAKYASRVKYCFAM